MSRQLVIRPEACIGCKSCAMICSLNRCGAISPESAAVTVYMLDDGGAVPMLCMHCQDAVCMEVCPTGALHRDEQTNAVVLDAAKCIGCGQCALHCPFGRVHQDAHRAVMVKCDLCGGHPKCADICPAGAIDFLELQKQTDLGFLGRMRPETEGTE